jgi:hypothetical protein
VNLLTQLGFIIGGIMVATIVINIVESIGNLAQSEQENKLCMIIALVNAISKHYTYWYNNQHSTIR